MLLAILTRHGGIFTASDEIYANVVGGIKVTETSSDLAILISIVSSLKDSVVPHDSFFFGELGLNGEIRQLLTGKICKPAMAFLGALALGIMAFLKPCFAASFRRA
jgi:predicted ATP-dependent serine protease